MFEEVIALAGKNDVLFMMCKLKNKYKTDKHLFNFKQDDITLFIMKNQYEACYDFFIDTLENIMRIAVYGSIVLAIYSSILLYNYIVISIENRKKEIGILRSLGLSKQGIFNIFFFESLYISAINFIISICACGILVIFINLNLKKRGLIIALSRFGFLQIGLIFIILLFVSFIATLFTTNKMVIKKPNEIIKNI